MTRDFKLHDTGILDLDRQRVVYSAECTCLTTHTTTSESTSPQHFSSNGKMTFLVQGKRFESLVSWCNRVETKLWDCSFHITGNQRGGHKWLSQKPVSTSYLASLTAEWENIAKIWSIRPACWSQLWNSAKAEISAKLSSSSTETVR